MTRKLRFGSKAGVTLIELMVVLLIATILVIALLPLFKPLIEEAKYTAEAKPVLSAVTTKIELYRYEHDFLPGLAKTSDPAIPYTNAAMPSGSSEVGAAATAQGIIQGFMAVPGVPANEAMRYQTMSKTPAGTVAAAITATLSLDHIATDLTLDYEDFSGKRMRPSDFFYRCDQGGYNSGAYMYVVGVFGGGAGSSLTAGKGFAILTVVNPSAKVKRILTWERYKNATANVASQITIMSEGDATPGPAPAASKLVDVCYLPSIGLLLSNDPTTAAADCQTALNSLGLAGWK